LASGAAQADDETAQPIDIAASSLPEAIAELSREARVSIGTEGALPHLRTRKLHGRMSVATALSRLLAGTGYRARRVGRTAWRIEPITAQAARPAVGDAAPAPSPEYSAPPPIVVTGAKRELELLELPLAVSVFGLADQERLDAGSDTALIAGETEGLSLTSLGPGRNRMFFRGIADSPFTGESQSTVAVVLDDTRITYSAPDPDIRLVDVDRVEVLKGPQGSLYGTGALGGIYHLVTRRPKIDETSLELSAGAEIAVDGGTGESATGVANLPLLPGTAALRLVGYTAREPGWIDTGDRHNSNSSRVTGARAGLGIEPGGGWRLDLTGFAQWLQSRDSRYVYDDKTRARPDQIAEPHDNDLRHLSLRLARQAGGPDIVAASGLTWHEVDDELDATIGAESFGLADPLLLKTGRQYRVWDSELRVSDDWGGVGWLLGLSHVAAKQEALSSLHAQGDASLVIDDDRRRTSDSAAFADLTIPLAEGLKLNPGARLYTSTIKETRILPVGTVKRKQRRTGVTPSLALSWQPCEDRLIYLRYGSAFRQGGTDISSDGDPVVLKGDELLMIEAGWRERLGARGRFEIGGWYAWWDDVQSDLLQPDGLIETENAGNARIFGVEASLDLALSPSWRIEAGANVTSAMLVRNGLGIELHDRRLPVVPKYTLRAALRHDFTIGGVNAWLRAKVHYVGPSRLSFDPELDRHMGKVLETRIEGHARAGPYEFALAAENVLGRKANGFAFGNSLRLSRFDQFTPQPPLTLSLSVLRRF